jgi:hypothetical protein
MPRVSTVQNLPTAHALLASAPHALPANDAHASDPLPRFILTDARRAELAAEAARLPENVVKPLPAYLDARLRWMGGLLATAWTDQRELGLVPLGGGSPVTRAELLAFGDRLAYARESVVGRSVTTVLDLSSLSDAALRRVARDAQQTLCRALPVWFFGKDDPATRSAHAVVREVAAARAGKHVTPNTLKLLKVVDRDARIEPWLRALPRGEGDALDTLRAEHPEWVRREQLATSKTQRPAPVDDRVLRAWALLGETLGRILQAGRYLTRSRSDRPRAYRAFARPAATRTRTPKKAPPRGDTQPTDGAPKVTPT